MKTNTKQSKIVTILFATQPKFLTASVSPVLVGTALGVAVVGSFQPLLFILALLAIAALHIGSNMNNDYFDHLSANDWLNKNPTPFSGGSRFIQKGSLTPKEMLITALIFLVIGSVIGIIIVLLTKSIFILILGLAGLLGGFFYTASPLRLGYRRIGELNIALLFGFLPVYGAYYLQTQTIDSFVLLPAAIVAILIFLVILINEFPDLPADAAVNKRTWPVCFGITASIWIYRVTLLTAYLLAAIALFLNRLFFFSGLLFMLTLPLACMTLRFINKKNLTKTKEYRANQLTVLLHLIGSIALTAGFIISAMQNHTQINT